MGEIWYVNSQRGDHRSGVKEDTAAEYELSFWKDSQNQVASYFRQVSQKLSRL